MDLNYLLLWFITISCFAILIRAFQMRSEQMRGWAVLAGLLLALITLAFYLVPQSAGLIGGGVWFVFFLLPILGLRWVTSLIYQDRYAQASQLATVLGWLHPLDGWRHYPSLLWALALAQRGKMEQAIAILNRYASPATSIGRMAITFQYRVDNRWDEFLNWVQTQGILRFLTNDFSLMLHYLRALGETGDLNTLLHQIEHLKSPLERTGNLKLLNLIRLFALAFCGEPERLQQLLHRSSGFSAHSCQFWLGTAELAAGHPTQATQRLLDLHLQADGLLQQAIAHRLNHPLANPQVTLAPPSRRILTQLDQDARHESRYSRPFTFVSRTAYVTYGLIAINLGMFGLSEVSGGSQNLETLYRLGALVPVEVWAGDWWRIVTANFLHFGGLHLSMNMMGLYLLGGFVETRLGIYRYLLIYCTSGIGAMAIITWISVQLQFGGHIPVDQILVGASGAIMGLIGAIAAIMLYGWRNEKSRIAARNFRLLLFVIGVQVVFDLTTPNVSFAGHTLGLTLGFLITTLLYKLVPQTT